MCGIAVPVRDLMKSHARLPKTSTWLITRTLLRMIWCLIPLHLTQSGPGMATHDEDHAESTA